VLSRFKFSSDGTFQSLDSLNSERDKYVYEIEKKGDSTLDAVSEAARLTIEKENTNTYTVDYSSYPTFYIVFKINVSLNESNQCDYVDVKSRIMGK
jgi:hypothetical protein